MINANFTVLPASVACVDSAASQLRSEARRRTGQLPMTPARARSPLSSV